jgi:hypothetical protein
MWNDNQIVVAALDPAIQDVITTVAEAIDDGITDIVTTPDTQKVATMEATSWNRRPEKNNSTQDSCNTKRLKTSALGNAVIGNRIEKCGALDDITPAKKRTNRQIVWHRSFFRLLDAAHFWTWSSEAS